MRAHWLVSLALLLAAACGGDDGWVEMEGFPYLANFKVYQYPNGQAQLYACFYRYRFCEEAGTVQVDHASQMLNLETASNASAQWYEGWLNGTSIDEPFRFTWSGAGQQSSITGEVSMADAFTISAPRGGSILSAASPLMLDWTGGSADGLVAWGYTAQCPDSSDPFDDYGHLVPDSGHLELPLDWLSLHDGCCAELWLERLQRGGTSSPHADIVSSQARFVDVFIGP
jgi:hypothetical protein